MAFAITMLPAGVPADKKQQLLAGVKAACAEGFEIEPFNCFAWIQEIEKENMEPDVEELRVLLIYTTYGKELLGKQKITKLFDEICLRVFGAENKGLPIVLFKEHTDDNTGSNGTIRSLKPILAAK